MNSLYKDCTVPSSYLVNQSNKTVYQRVMSLVSALLNMDLKLRWVVFDGLFTSRKQWAAGGERSHCNMVCATLNRFYCGEPRPARPERAARAAKSIIPMNFPSRLGGADGVENHSQKVLRGSNDPFPRKTTLSAQSPGWI